MKYDEICNLPAEAGIIATLITHPEFYFSNDLIIRIYYLIYKTLSVPDNHTFYFELKQTLFDNFRSFDGLELQELFGAILNYCIAQINDGNHIFQDEMISVYDLIFEKGIMLGAVKG